MSNAPVQLVSRQPLPLTFHRAFDDAVELDAALRRRHRDRCQADLTYGGSPTAPAGIENPGALECGERIHPYIPGVESMLPMSLML